jgi:hypothetical protein
MSGFGGFGGFGSSNNNQSSGFGGFGSNNNNNTSSGKRNLRALFFSLGLSLRYGLGTSWPL